MKCPKCGYLGFEDVDRCRNCGYDFSLSQAETLPELSLRGEPVTPGPLDDLVLIDAAAPGFSAEASGSASASLDRGRTSSRPPPSSDLPLFGSATTALSDDAPLITRPAPPRAPLAVRRATPEVPRIRSTRARAPMLDLNAFEPEPHTSPVPGPPPAESVEPDGVSIQPAGIVARIAAAMIDLSILATIDVVVVYLTMQVCGVTMAEIDILPKAPLAAFLGVQNLGYFVGFTMAGQTLGKMAAGIKVVSAEDEATPDFSRSLLRTLVWVALAVPAGLGFITALFGQEHRGLHDLFAGTKVVRAAA